MKFTVELDDFYMSEEDSNGIEQDLRDYVKGQVLNQIWANIKDLAKAQIANEVQKVIDAEISKQVEIKVASLIESGTININKVDVPFLEHLQKQFNSNTGWSNPNDYLKSLAKKFGDQLKAQYDVVFANHIVQQINANGMLKEDVAKLLLSKKG